MLDWLVSIQLPGGGFQGGMVNQTPVVPVTFNTGQMLMGLAAGVSEFGDVYRGAMVAAGDWLVQTQDADGCWRRFPSPFAGRGDKAYEKHVSWGLIEAERLEQGRQGRENAKGSEAQPGPVRQVDPFAKVKASVHQGLIDSLGPQLYDPHLKQADLEQRVRLTLQTVLEGESTPLSASDRTRISQEVADEILGHGPLEPLLRDPEVTEIMVNGPHQIFIERAGKHLSGRRHLHQRGAPSSHDRQDRRSRRAPGRRVPADGRRKTR